MLLLYYYYYYYYYYPPIIKPPPQEQSRLRKLGKTFPHHKSISTRMATNLKFLPISSASSILPSSGVRSSIHNKSTFNTSSLSKNARHPLVSSIFNLDTAGKYSTPFRVSYRNYNEEDDDDGEDCSFEAAAALFNKREYYRCHDVLESLWIKSEEPTRTLYHGILQCAVGFHHLFNQVGLLICCCLLFYLQWL